MQRLAISKTLTQIIKRERLWDKVNRILTAYPLRAFATMPVDKVNRLRFEFESVYPALCAASGNVINAIQKWRESYAQPLPFVWRGEDYMARVLGQVMTAPPTPPPLDPLNSAVLK